MAPKQMSLSMQHDAGFERHRKPTRRDVFLAEMDQVVPWTELCAVIAPYYPKDPEPGAGGRRPVGLERMLHIHFLQQWYALPDPGVEEALYDSAAMRRFVGIDLGQEGASTRLWCASSGTCWRSTVWPISCSPPYRG